MKLFIRSRVKDLERRLSVLEAEAAERKRPVLFNEYEKFPSPVPLGQVSARHFASLPGAVFSDKLDAVQEILLDNENARKFTIFIETTEGVFVRTLESDAKLDVQQDDSGFVLKFQWAPIHVGRTLTILDTAITYRDKVFNRVSHFHGITLMKGDELRIDYTFKN